jgi:CubicO group peptidase (beta-lactamase class C family)
MLIGIAIDEGRIRSVDDLAAAYVPALEGTEYGRTSLRHLLQMSSGVRFNEEASPGFVTDDLIQFVLDTYMRVGPGGVGAVTSFNDRERPAGTKFSYSSVETQVLGLVLTRAIGRPVAEYLEQKIWQPIGAEADATFASDPEGAKMNPPVLRAPNGVMQEGAEFHGAGKPYYDPAQITVPTLLVLGEWDRDTPPYMAQTLFPLLVNAPGKRFIMLAEGTHTIMMEKNRLELFRAVQGFLDEEGGS